MRQESRRWRYRRLAFSIGMPEWRIASPDLLLLVLLMLGGGALRWLLRAPLTLEDALAVVQTGGSVGQTWLFSVPGYARFVTFLLGFDLLWLQVVQMGLSVLLIPLGYDLARRLFDGRSGLIFATLLTIWLPLVDLPGRLLSSNLILFLLALHLWLLVHWRDSYRADEPSVVWLLGAGVALACATLVYAPLLWALGWTLLFMLIEVWRRLADDEVVLRGEWVPTKDVRFDAGGRQPDRFTGRVRGWSWRLSGRRWLFAVVQQGLILLIAWAVTLTPWMLTAYRATQQFILIDTQSLVDLAVGLHAATGQTATPMPSEQPQGVLLAEMGNLVRAQPLAILAGLWAERDSLWGAGLTRESLTGVAGWLGMLGNLIWMLVAPLSLVVFGTRLREGGVRVLAWAWLVSASLMLLLGQGVAQNLVLIWFLLLLYGAVGLYGLGAWVSTLRDGIAGSLEDARYFLSTPGVIVGCILMLALLWQIGRMWIG